MAHAANQVQIADKRITLYQRDDVKDGVWQCRVSVKGHKGYVRRSTGKTDLDKAKERSLQILGELQQRVAQSLPLGKKTFAEVALGFCGTLRPVGKKAEIAKAATASSRALFSDIWHRTSASGTLHCCTRRI